MRDGGMTDDRLLWHLVNWAEWMEDKRSDFTRGYPSRASGGMGQSQSRDFDAMVATVDTICAKAVDAILDGACSHAERLSVWHFHLDAVFRFPRLGCGAHICYAAAKEKVRRGLMRRGIE